MINHAYSVLYGRTGTSATGVLSGLTAQRPADAVASALDALRGKSEATADAFAVQAVKLLDASTFRAVLWEHDERMTFQPEELSGAQTNSRETVDLVLGMSGVLIQLATFDDLDVTKGYVESRARHEQAAALLAGLVRKLSQVSE